MNGASNTPAPECAAGADDNEEALASMVREIAAHLQHVAGIAAMAVDTDPDRGAHHILDLCAELKPQVRALAARLGPAAVALFLA